MYFSYPQPVTICHHFTQPIINRTPPRSTFPRQFQPPLFPPRPNGNAKKNYKPTQLSRFRTRIARGRARSTCASAHARRNIRAARSVCARPRRRVYNIAAGPVICCRSGGLLPVWRAAAWLAGCCLAGGLLPGWRPAAGLASCCRAGGLLPGWRAAAGLPGLAIRPDPVQLVQIAHLHSVVLCAILQITLRSVDIRTPACYHAITPSETATDQRSRRPAGPRVAIWARRHDPQKQEVKT